MSLQARLDAAAGLGPEGLARLLEDVCAAKDARAAVYVYDLWKARAPSGQAGVPDRLTRALRAVESDRGGTPWALSVPQDPTGARRLDPARRIHKICKGWRLSERNGAAAEHLQRASAWVAGLPSKPDARSSAGARIHVAKLLRAELGVSPEVARGVVTSLKRRGVL